MPNTLLFIIESWHEVPQINSDALWISFILALGPMVGSDFRLPIFGKPHANARLEHLS